jgi:UDP-galactopyranose mutase
VSGGSAGRRGRILVVGAGLAGATHARVLAEAGRRVDVVDRRPHVAGNAYDEVDATGVRRHAYGPHLFHTNSDRVMAWLARFAEFVPWEHRVTVRLPGGVHAPLPVSRLTVNAALGLSLADAAQMRDFLARVAVPHAAPRNAAEHLHSRIGVALTDLLFRPYSRRMWGVDLEALDASVVRRIPIRHDDETRYFTSDRHQGLPRDGYTDLVSRILDHPRIRVTPGVPFRRAMLEGYAFCFNSMAIDEYFDRVHGPLPYRSIRFHHEEVPAATDTGPTAQVNFADGSPWTRRSDWSLLPGHVVRATGRKTVTFEDPCADHENGGERYYPVPDGDGRNAALYRAYAALAGRERNVRFIGRCGTYRYLNMDQVVGQSLASATGWLAGAPLAPSEEAFR